jgi:hypothetical protein
MHDNQEALNKATEYLKSDSNERTKNNTMSHQYRVLSEEEKSQMLAIKDMGAQFVGYCDDIGQSRELSLAKTKIEEAVMWAVKSLTK